MASGNRTTAESKVDILKFCEMPQSRNAICRRLGLCGDRGREFIQDLVDAGSLVQREVSRGAKSWKAYETTEEGRKAVEAFKALDDRIRLTTVTDPADEPR